MNIPKLFKTVILLFCICLSVPAFANTLDPVIALNAGPGTTPAKTIDPMVRLQEIKNMDIKSLSRTEKRDLRKEVKEIRRQARSNSNGIYLSVGAVIIIVLLLILLL